jgi:hypothetical protein
LNTCGIVVEGAVEVVGAVPVVVFVLVAIVVCGELV